MLQHFHFSEFKQIILTKIEIFINKKIWKIINVSYDFTDKIIIFTMWIFKYKFDEKKYLVKYKIKLIIRDDMQFIKQNTYAAIFAAKIFRVFMIVVVAFDFEIKQYDAINVFANNSIDEIIYCKFWKK
jgi:hypothetical protein